MIADFATVCTGRMGFQAATRLGIARHKGEKYNLSWKLGLENKPELEWFSILCLDRTTCNPVAQTRQAKSTFYRKSDENNHACQNQFFIRQ